MAKIIGKRIKVVDCVNCDSVISFKWDDVYSKPLYGYTYSYIKCPCCEREIMIRGGEEQHYRTEIARTEI